MKLWRRRLPVSQSGQREIEYVPVALSDSRPIDERWRDQEYLRAVSGFSGNSTFACEVADALAACRDAADRAGTPEELRGIQVGVRLLRDLLTMPARAKNVLRAQREAEQEALKNGDCRLG